MAGKKCKPGCTCDRHSRSKDSYRSGSTKCEPGCTCGRHKRVITDEHRANIVLANKARIGESHPCPEGCTCDRHKGYHFGGSAKGRTYSPRAKSNISKAARDREYTPEQRAALAERMRNTHDDPEFEKRRIDALINYWQNVVTPEELSRGVKRSSRHEYAVAPYMAALGYEHNCGEGQIKIGRKTPDFIDLGRKRIYEYFGVYWHPDRDEAQRVVEYYDERGWNCSILWEDESLAWVQSHEALVSEDDHQLALRALNDTKRLQRPV